MKALMAIAVAAILILCGYVAVNHLELRRKIDVLEHCGSGRSIDSCITRFGEPDKKHYGESGSSIYLWKSGSEVSGNQDIAFITKDNIIVEILNLDLIADRQRLTKVYVLNPIEF